MIATENACGDIDLWIPPALFALVADHLDTADRHTVCHFLEHLPLRNAVCLERLAVDNSDLARDYLRRVVVQQARRRPVGKGTAPD